MTKEGYRVGNRKSTLLQIGASIIINSNCRTKGEYRDWIVVKRLTKKINIDVGVKNGELIKNYHKLPIIFYHCLSISDERKRLYLDDKIITEDNGIISCDARWVLTGRCDDREISLLPYKYETYQNGRVIPDTTCVNTYYKKSYYLFRNHHGGQYRINECDGFLTFSNCYNFNI